MLATAQRLGLKVPEQLSIAGFDDSWASALVWPPLTTVHQPKEDKASAAVELLVASRAEVAGADPPVQHLVLPHTLALRGSTAAPPPAAGALRRARGR